MKAPNNVPRLRDYLRMLANGWVVILTATVLSAGAVVGAQQLLGGRTYVASAQVFAVVPGDAGVKSAFEGNRGATIRMDTYSQLARSGLVTERTIDDVGLDIAPAELAEGISVAPEPGTVSPFAFPMSALLRISYTGDNPDTTVDVANALAKNLISASREVEWTGDGPGAELVLVDSATSAHGGGPSVAKNLAVGGSIGLVLSAVMVLGFAIARGTVLDRNHVGHIARQSISGEVPWDMR